MNDDDPPAPSHITDSCLQTAADYKSVTLWDWSVKCHMKSQRRGRGGRGAHSLFLNGWNLETGGPRAPCRKPASLAGDIIVLCCLWFLDRRIVQQVSWSPLTHHSHEWAKLPNGGNSEYSALSQVGNGTVRFKHCTVRGEIFCLFRKCKQYKYKISFCVQIPVKSVNKLMLLWNSDTEAHQTKSSDTLMPDIIFPTAVAVDFK